MSRYRSAYPADWKEISKRIRFVRAGNRCEWCGAENYKPHPVTGSRVILTVAHLGAKRDDGSPGDKHDKSDVRECNLAALCQRCHLNFDRQDHMNRRLFSPKPKVRMRVDQHGWAQLELDYGT